jgi:hypothetical protein
VSIHSSTHPILISQWGDIPISSLNKMVILSERLHKHTLATFAAPPTSRRVVSLTAAKFLIFRQNPNQHARHSFNHSQRNRNSPNSSQTLSGNGFWRALVSATTCLSGSAPAAFLLAFLAAFLIALYQVSSQRAWCIVGRAAENQESKPTQKE